MLLCADAHCAPVGGVWVVSPSVCMVALHTDRYGAPPLPARTATPKNRADGVAVGCWVRSEGLTRAGTCARVRARGLADCRPSARTSEADTLKNADGAPLHGGYYITPYIVFVGALFMLLSVLESKSI